MTASAVFPPAATFHPEPNAVSSPRSSSIALACSVTAVTAAALALFGGFAHIGLILLASTPVAPGRMAFDGPASLYLTLAIVAPVLAVAAFAFAVPAVVVRVRTVLTMSLAVTALVLAVPGLAVSAWVSSVTLMWLR